MKEPTAKGKERIEILKDAIAQLKAEVYTATHGIYVELNYDGLTRQCNIRQIVGSLENRAKGEGQCRVCADGALLVSSIRKDKNRDLRNRDNFSYVSDFPEKPAFISGNTKMDIEKRGLWDMEQINLMEYHFEGRHDNMVSVKNPAKRIIKIFENAIKNDGLFKPQ